MGKLLKFGPLGNKIENADGSGGVGSGAGGGGGISSRRRLSGAYMLVIGILIGALVFGGGIAIAGSAIMAAPSTSRVFVDGAEVFSEVYTINDSNYFKLRDIARALDIGVWYDEYRDSVHIETDIEYDPLYAGVRKTTPPIRQIESLTAFQKSQTVDVNNKKFYDLGASSTQSYSATITIVDLIRGEEAAETIKTASVYNPGAGLGKEFILALVRAKITATADKNYVVLSDIRMNMNCYSSDGNLYPLTNPSNINPLNEQPRKVGETVEGWIAFAVDRNDPEPRVQLGTVTGATELAWFALFD